MGFNRVSKFVLGAAISIYIALSFGVTTAWTERIDYALKYLLGDETVFLAADEIAALAQSNGAWCFAETFTSDCDWLEEVSQTGDAGLLLQTHSRLPVFGFDAEAEPQIVVASAPVALEGDAICPAATFSDISVYAAAEGVARAGAPDLRPATKTEAADFRFSIRKPWGDDLCYRVSGYSIPLLMNEYFLHPMREGAPAGPPLKFYASAAGGARALNAP